MNNLNMRRILKQPTLRMEEGGEGEPLDGNDPRNFWPGPGAAPRVQVPQGVNMGRNQYLMRNPGVLANQTASPSPGQLPFSHIQALMKAPGPGIPAQPAAVPTPDQSTAETLRLARSGAPATTVPNESAAETSRLARSGTPSPAAPVGFSPLRNNPTVLSNGKGSFGDAAGLAAAPSNYSGPTAGGTPGNPTASTHATMDALIARQPGKQLADAQMAAVTRPSTGMNNYTGSSAPAVPPAVWQSVQQSFAKPSSGFGAVTLRDGGTLRTGMGGNVPGTGTGDKIPAKYEPGEFVVSNAMLDASPGLREELHDLRGNVLAQKGMTEEQADAKAMGYSGSPQGEDDGHQAQGNAVVARSAGSNLRNNPATDFRRNQGGGKTPELTIHALDSFVSDRVPDAYGSSTIAGEATADQKLAAAARTAAQNRATARAATAAAGSAPTITAAAPAGSASYQAGQRVGQASRAAGFAEAGAGKALGLTGPFVEAAVDTQDKPIEDYRRRFYMDLNQTHDDGTTGGRLRQAGSDYGVRLAGVVQDGGAKILDLPVNTLNAGLRFFGGKGDVSLPGGSFTDYLQQNDNPEIHKRVMSQQEGYVPPAPTNAAQPATNSVATPTPSLRPATPTLRDPTPEPQIDWAARKADRDALTQKDIALGDKMEATRLAREQAHWDAMDAPQRGQLGYAAHMARKNATDIQQMQSDSQLRGHQISAEAQMYGSKLSNQLGRYNALREQSNADRTFAAGRYDADMINAGKSEDAARGAFKNRFDTTDKDGKVVARPDLESAAHEEAMRQSNGKWGTLTPAERAKNLSDAYDHIKLISSAREHQNNGILQAVGITQKDAPHGRMPGADDLKGATLSELGIGEGMTSMNVGRGDYKLVTKSGKVMHFGRKDLSDDQLGYLERQGVIAGKGK